MKKKYELTNETKVVDGRILHRIRALRTFGNVIAGDLGGWIEKEENLSHSGNAWVTDNALVTDTARVTDSARVSGDALVTTNSDYFCIKGAGSQNRNTTFFKCQTGEIRVNCGCFNGTLAEFAAKVHETHGGTMYEREYNAAIELVKIHFDIED